MNFYGVMAFSLLLAGSGLVIAGCNSPNSTLNRSKENVEDYLAKVEEKNSQAQRDMEFEYSKDPTRGYNLKTKRYEYVPEDTKQRWNEENQRWEFNPQREDDD